MPIQKSEIPSDKIGKYTSPLLKVFFRYFCHPFSALGFGFLIVVYFILNPYSGNEIGHVQAIPYLLQGSTDWGGSNIYAFTVIAYALLGVMGCFYLIERMSQFGKNELFIPTLKRAFFEVRFYVLFYLYFGVSHWGYDARITPNDFRNMFFFAGCVYFCCLLWITLLSRTKLSLYSRFVLAPAIIFIWVFLGMDGMTIKAGQILRSGVDPSWNPHSIFHLFFLYWHRFIVSASQTASIQMDFRRYNI